MTVNSSAKLAQKTRRVKPVLGVACAAFFTALCTSSFASEYDVVETTISLSALATQQGVANTYSSLVQVATDACEEDNNMHYQIYIDDADCIEDLLDQFVLSASQPVLTNHHAGQ